MRKFIDISRLAFVLLFSRALLAPQHMHNSPDCSAIIRRFIYSNLMMFYYLCGLCKAEQTKRLEPRAEAPRSCDNGREIDIREITLKAKANGKKFHHLNCWFFSVGTFN